MTGDAVRYRSRDLGVDFATPEIDLDDLVAPRSELPPLLDVKTERDHRLPRRVRRPDGPGRATSTSRRRSSASSRPIRCRVASSRTCSAARSHFLTQRGADGAASRRNFANPAALDGWVERVDMHGKRGALRAFPPRMIHMLAGNSPDGLHLVDRAGRAGQGDQRVQDAVERPVHLRRHAEDHGRGRSRPSGGAVDVGGVLARRRRAGRAHALPPAVLRQDRRVGRRRRDQQRHPVPRARDCSSSPSIPRPRSR